jgi:N6-L-threonylcarbamoyladenine synthase
VTSRARSALEKFQTAMAGVTPTLVVAGGVAANQAIGGGLRAVAEELEVRLVVPPIPLCTDNGVMVAWAGAERLALNDTADLAVSARPRWPLDSPDMGLRHGH